MPRERTNNTTVTLRLPKKAADWVKAHAKASGESVSAVYRRALKSYITAVLQAEQKEAGNG